MCLSVCKLANCYIPRLRASRTVLYDSLWRFKRMYCMDFAEDALFSSSGDIYLGPLPSTIDPSFHAPWQLFDGQNEQQ